VQEAVVEAKDSDHALATIEGAPQRGMVVQAQVARKPDDACHEWSTEPVSLRTMAQTHESFPLFPLGLVLLPHELVPLHIFEERYKTMIGECLEQETQFGIVWLSDDGLREVGCSARIVRVLESFDDGRINILVEGTEPFRLMRRIEDLPYPAGDIEALQDDDDGGDSHAAAAARRRYADLLAEVTDERPDEQELDELDAYGMAATLDVALEAKQMLLELRSERARLEQLEGLFAEALSRIRHAERAAERARGNGSVR
jgi:Lon protease-like protein